MEMWSRERNYGLGSSADGGKYGPGRETAVQGQVLVAGSVVQGEKLWSLVKCWWREVWSRERNYGLWSNAGGGKCGPWERNCGFGSSAGGGKYGLGSKTVPPSHPRPCPGMVQGEKLRPRSTPSPPECGPRREIMVFGQALVAGSMVQGAKPCPWVTPIPARVWSRERNRGPGSPRPRPSVVQGAKLRPWVKPVPAKVWSREPNCGPGHPLPRRSMV